VCVRYKSTRLSASTLPPLLGRRLDKSRVADATVSGGLARYINHSCEPNCYTKVFNGPDGVARMGIYAKRDIDLGEELAYDYMVGVTGGGRHGPVRSTCKADRAAAGAN